MQDLPKKPNNNSTKGDFSMSWYTPVAVGMVVCFVSVSAIMGHEPPAKPKAKVELRWIEGEHIEGLTDFEMRYPASENRDDFAYPHKKPALVLTPAMVAKVSITHFVLASRDQYGVKIQITEKAREALAMTFEDTKTRWITVVVDGRCWGTRRYDPSNEKSDGGPATWAKNYNPHVGFTSSKAYVQRVADALK